MVRPVRAPCGERTALSWDCAALRGHDSTRCHAYGLRGPARRFHALRVLRVGRTSGLLRASPSMRLALPFRGPSHHPRTVPGARRLHASDDASFPGLSCPTTHAGTADPLPAGLPPCGVPRPRFGYLHRGVHHRPSESLAAPERPRASPFEAFSSIRSDPLSEILALLPLRASIRLAPIGACGRDRLQGLVPGSSSFCPSSPCGPDAPRPPGILPFRAFSPSVLRALRGFTLAPSPRVGRD